MTDEQYEETRALRERAESITLRKPGPDGVVDITHSEFLEVHKYAQTKIRMRSDFVGGYENMRIDAFLDDIRRHGDTEFFGDAGGSLFRISGAPGGTIGPYVGGDINYIGIGIAFAQANRSEVSANVAVSAWNGTGNGTFANTPQRLMFTSLGYRYWRDK